MNARLVQSLAVIAALAVALVGGSRLRLVRRWTRKAAQTVGDDVEALFI
jgi:hypothetical protein